MTQQTIPERLKAIRMIEEEGIWVRYEAKPRDVDRRLCIYEYFLKRRKWKRVLLRTVIVDEKEVHNDSLRRKKSRGYHSLASTSMFKPITHGPKSMVCIWWEQLDNMYYQLLKPGQTVTGEQYRTQIMCLSQAFKD